MLILSLDLATKTGFALGRPGAVPRSGSVTLKKPKEDWQTLWRNLGCFLRDQFVFGRPDLIVYEAAMDPAANAERGDGRRTAVMAWGHVAAVEAICGPLGLRTEALNVQTIRKHFTGKARWGSRPAAKAAVIERCHALGLMPASCKDDNRADALAAWDFACATKAPKEHAPSGFQPGMLAGRAGR